MSTPQLYPGDPAPLFTLDDADALPVSLGEALERSENGVVVYFYPQASTPGCTTEACDFRDNLSFLTGAGYVVLGVSPDAPEALRAFRDEQHLTFALLSDPDFAVAKAYGSYGSKTFGENTFTGTLRSTFVAGRDGVLTHAEYDVAATGHVARLREALGV